MVGILIVAHGTFGESLVQCASHVLGGRPTQLMQLGVSVHDDPADVLPEVKRLIRLLDDGTGVLVLTDVYGATPSNITQKALVPGRIEGIAGASLPMLVRALTYRNEPLRTVVTKAMSGGVEGVYKMPAAIENATAGN